jgi:pimeloyl-ACP methyl ester carboxylesterase
LPHPFYTRPPHEKPVPLDFHRAANQNAWPDTTQDKVSSIPVQENVGLEVIDWGGTGRPLVLLAGLGNTAHIFDKFAPKLTPNCHVYGITCRGFGESSVPPPISGNHAADRLADDALVVFDALQLKKPVLAGHSIADEEPASIGSRLPEKVPGLIYLEAGFSQSDYIASLEDLQIDSNEVVRGLEQLTAHGAAQQDRKRLVYELLTTSLPQLQKDLLDQQKELEAVPDLPAGTSIPTRSQRPRSDAAQAILEGEQKYSQIKCPALLIAAVPYAMGPAAPGADLDARTAAQAKDLAETTAHAAAFQAGVPTAHVVRLPNASHFIFLSNEADVLREMNAFLAKLP